MLRPKLAIILLLLALSVRAQSDAVFTGKILKHQGADTLFCYVPSANSEGYDTLLIDRKGCFTYSRPLTKDTQMIMFWEGRGSAKGDAACILLEPGKKLQCELSFTGAAPDVMMQVMFKGKNTAKQVYANQYYQHFSRRSEFADDKVSSLNSLKEFNAYADDVMSDMYATLASIKDDDSFVASSHNTLTELKAHYCFDYAIARQKKGFRMQDDADFQAMIDKIDVNDTNQVYQISSMLEWRVAADASKYAGLSQEAALLACLRDATANADVRTRIADNALQSSFFLMSFGMSPSDPSFRQLYEQYILTSSNEQFVAFCREQLANMEVTAPGNAPVDFELADADDKACTFAGLIKDGAVTYFDFWATWCGPCKREIPKLATLAEQYKDNPKVRFISISIDADHDAWKKMIAADRPQWEQYIVPSVDSSEGIRRYNISAIPRFMLFGTDGKLVDANAKRPSDPALKQQIDNLIE